MIIDILMIEKVSTKMSAHLVTNAKIYLYRSEQNGYNAGKESQQAPATMTKKIVEDIMDDVWPQELFGLGERSLA